MRLYRGLRPRVLHDIELLKDAGVPMLPGSDAAVLLIQPGASLIDELVLFVSELEMSPTEALRSATIGATEFLGVDRDYGRIAPALRADLLLLDSDPLVDIENLRDLHAVIVGGKVLDEDGRTSLLDEVAKMPELQENDWLHPKRQD